MLVRSCLVVHFNCSRHKRTPGKKYSTVQLLNSSELLGLVFTELPALVPGKHQVPLDVLSLSGAFQGAFEVTLTIYLRHRSP